MFEFTPLEPTQQEEPMTPEQQSQIEAIEKINKLVKVVDVDYSSEGVEALRDRLAQMKGLAETGGAQDWVKPLEQASAILAYFEQMQRIIEESQ